MSKGIYTWAILLTLLASQGGLAQEEEETASAPAERAPSAAADDAAPAAGRSGVVNLSTTVTGNQEQPKVLYIVPWQAAQDERIVYEPLNSQSNRVFSHIERSEHVRELEFISELGGNIGN